MSDTAPNHKPKVSRRKFLVRGGLSAVGLVALGTFVMRNPIRRRILKVAEGFVPPYSGTGTEAPLWFEITRDNGVVFHSPKVEMGQGTFTGLAQIVADELDVEISRIDVRGATTATGVVDGMSTGGSFSVAALWDPLRELAATMREMIKGEAARQLDVEVTALTTRDGVVSGNGQTKTYAEIAADADGWEIPDPPPLRPAGEYRNIGKPVPRIDLAPKVFGDPIFGLDAEMPGMLHASVIRPEHIGARFARVETSRAESMPGVIAVLREDDWVGIVAESYPQAVAAKRHVDIEWDVPRKWTEDDLRDLLRVGKGNKMVTQVKGAALAEGEGRTLEFSTPLGAHAQIEPNAALAHVEGEQATVVLSTQVVGVTQKQVAQALELPLDAVNIVPTYLGGGFGRRLNTAHAVVAAKMSRTVGRPVKYVFSRKEEFQHDLFRPPTHHIMRGKLNADGLLDSLEHHYASGDVAIGSVILPSVVHGILGTDFGAMRGGNIQYDVVPNHRAVQWHTTLPFATSWWRSLGLLANTFAIESFVDEMALEAGQDPVEFRTKQIGDEGRGPRLRSVIERAATRAGYRDQPSAGRAMGIAASVDAGSPCAHVAEVSIADGAIVVHKVTCVLDCGLVVNPDQVRAQCESSIVMGLSAALYERMTLDAGQLQPTIYGPYSMALMRHSPREIDVELASGGDRPLPVGEPPLGPIAAAIANAVRRLTGQRLTDLPLSLG